MRLSRRSRTRRPAPSGQCPAWLAFPVAQSGRGQPPEPAHRRHHRDARLAISAGKAGILDPFTVEKLPNLADIPVEFTKGLDDNATVFDYGVAGFTYNKNTLKNPPKSFQEFVDRTAAGEWVASLPGMAYAITPIMLIWTLAKALGGGVDNVDPFFEAIKKMRKHLVFWGGPERLLQSSLERAERLTSASISTGAPGLTTTRAQPGSTSSIQAKAAPSTHSPS